MRQQDSLPCEHHAEIAENQAEIAAHLLWLRGAGRWVVGLIGACLVSLIGYGATIIRYGWELSLASQANQTEIIRITSQIVELKQVDKDICSKLEKMAKQKQASE